MHSLPVQLSPSQQAVVNHRGAHLQVIACAGSGKTEAISRRVASLVAEGVDPASIVAFTFTERAAEELKARIVARVAEELGEEARGRLSPMFVGTIHGYCFRLLQDHLPRYGDFDVLDPNRHAAFLARHANHLQLKQLTGKQWESIERFSHSADVISNELISASQVTGVIGEIYRKYLDLLERFHCLTFGRIIQLAVEALQDPDMHARVHGALRHLIVDEYQDINPAQEELIRLLGRDPVQVCVVGDDDQAIYQWRGSDVSAIQQFSKQFKGAKQVVLDANRRSAKSIVETAERFAATIAPRLPKQMKPHRPDHASAIQFWKEETPDAEAEQIAEAIARFRKQGFRYRDIAVLYRSVSSGAGPLIDELKARQIPYVCGGRRGLFLQPDIDLFARIFMWRVDLEWREPGYGNAPVKVDKSDLVRDLADRFPGRHASDLEDLLDDLKAQVSAKQPANLVGSLYSVLNFLGVHEWDRDDPDVAARLGGFARFSEILADYEHATRRARWEDNDAGGREWRGGREYGSEYYWSLANFIQHFASSTYEEFEAEETPEVDAVDILTVHAAKGLEWPIVFMPGLQKSRFPSSRAGRNQNWLLDDAVLPLGKKRRYEGGDAEERRLFYVAMTRARDILFMSHFERQTNRSTPSPYLQELLGKSTPQSGCPHIMLKPEKPKEGEEPPLTISFSDLTDYAECGLRYRLAKAFGFQTQLVRELGYGRSIHHVLRRLAEEARLTKRVPTQATIDRLLNEEIYFPFANASSFDGMQRSARRVIDQYLRLYASDLQRVWATERSFELHLRNGILTGRADVILDQHEGRAGSLAIVDYKTVKGNEQDGQFTFQLQVYASAGIAEGLQVDAAHLHHLEDPNAPRTPVPIDAAARTGAIEQAQVLMDDLRSRKYQAKPEATRCGRCEYRNLCKPGLKVAGSGRTSR